MTTLRSPGSQGYGRVGDERCESGVSRARPQSALSGEPRGGGQRPVPTTAKFRCNSSAVLRPPQDAAVPPESPGSVGPSGVGSWGRGDRSPRGGKRCPAVQNLLQVLSPPRVRRVPQGKGSNKEDGKKVSGSSKVKCRMIQKNPSKNFPEEKIINRIPQPQQPQQSSPQVPAPRVPVVAVALSLMNEPQSRQPVFICLDPPPCLRHPPLFLKTSPDFWPRCTEPRAARREGALSSIWSPATPSRPRGVSGAALQSIRQEGIPAPPLRVPVTQLTI